MMVTVRSLGLTGITGYEVSVECFLSGGLPGFDVVGLPDAAVKESRERVRAAVKNCGAKFPVSRITVNLAPARVRKEGTVYDLPILLGILAAAEEISPLPQGAAFLGELSLSGALRPVTGVLPMALTAARLGIDTLYVPEANAAEATLADGLTVYGVTDVGQLIAHLKGEQVMTPAPRWTPGHQDRPLPDFADVMGQETVKRALEIAAAGGHNLCMVGPPGSGKSIPARRLPSLLPDLTRREALEDTVNQNPVLNKAGVVDAGGMGFVVLLQGMLDELHGSPAPADDQEPSPVPQRGKADFGGFETGEIQFGYCTEFICSRDTQKDPEALRAFLNGLGDSLVLVADDEIIKVHVHTNHPGKVLEEALTYGGLLTVKVENMRQQHTELLQQEGEPAPRQSLPPEKKYGFVAVAAGEGLAKVFFDLGVDGVIQGGQTMNPSTEDILKEIQKTPAEIVSVLPNNKNIILAAQQCVDLVEDKKVVVLQAKTVPQGISAMIAMNPDGEEAENTAAMEEAMGQVTTMEITYAARDSSFDGNAIQAGDYLLLVDNQLFGTEKSMETALEKLAQESQERGGEFHTIF